MSFLDSLTKNLGGQAAVTAATTLLPVLGGSLLSGLNTAATTAIKAAVTEIDGGLDHLASAFNAYQASNPVVQKGLSTLTTLAPQLGLTVLPSQDELLTHLKAAVAEVAAAFGVAKS